MNTNVRTELLKLLYFNVNLTNEKHWMIWTNFRVEQGNGTITQTAY